MEFSICISSLEITNEHLAVFNPTFSNLRRIVVMKCWFMWKTMYLYLTDFPSHQLVLKVAKIKANHD